MMNRRTKSGTPSTSAGDILRVQSASCLTRKRLVAAVSILEEIQRDRVDCRDALLNKLVEERIIWRELIDLELQEVDDQIERISEAAGEAPLT
jgi:hypothetical protein